MLSDEESVFVLYLFIASLYLLMCSWIIAAVEGLVDQNKTKTIIYKRFN